MRGQGVLVWGIGLVLAATNPGPDLSAQVPLGTVSRTGQTVTPAYEGWYWNADGTKSVSFGYFNRNYDETVSIPAGKDNFLEPGDPNQNQPTHFAPRRHWGVFTVIVPGDYSAQVRWTLRHRGETFSIPANFKPEFEIDALAGEAGSGNTPPVLQFVPDGPEGAGPTGLRGPSLETTVGDPLTLMVWTHDDGKTSGNVASSGRESVPVTLTWFQHQGPGEVEFSEESAQVEIEGGQMITTATFSEPGKYILRVRANDASGVRGAGHAQCCWTNGFVKVTVTP